MRPKSVECTDCVGCFLRVVAPLARALKWACPILRCITFPVEEKVKRLLAAFFVFCFAIRIYNILNVVLGQVFIGYLLTHMKECACFPV